MDAPAALKTIETGQLAFQEASSIYLDGKNVLSIVVEIDCARLLGGVAVLAVVGETLARGKLAVRLERTGRPEVKNMLLAPKQFDRVNRDLEIRDLYNSEDAFRLADTYRGAYRARLNANLGFWDSLDGKVDWSPDDERRPSPDRAGAGRLPDRRSLPTVRRARLVPRYRDGQPGGAPLPDLRGSQPQRRRDGHAVHLVGERRQWAPSPRRSRPGDTCLRAAVVSLPGEPQPGSSPTPPAALRRSR